MNSTDEKTMSLANKGQIFTLLDRNLSIQRVSKETGWSEDRIFYLQDGLKGTRARHECKLIWEEGRKDDAKRSQRSSRRKHGNNHERTTDTTMHLPSPNKRVSRNSTKVRANRSRPRRKTVRTDINSQGRNTTIAKGLRNHRDYVGE